MDPLDREMLVTAASAYIATFEGIEARAETEGSRQPLADAQRNLVRLLKELHAKYPDIHAFHFRGWLFNPVRIEVKSQEGKPLVIDFLQTLHDRAILEVE